MALLYLHLLLVFSFTGADAAIFTLHNNCRNTVWPGIQPSEGHGYLNGGGFRLKSGETVNISAPTDWSGRFWGRHGCSFDDSGMGTCVTGDCGGVLACEGAGGKPPASLAEFTLNNPIDYYDLSLVDGYNMQMSIMPLGGSGNDCKAASCVSDLNRSCPEILKVKKNKRVVACKSACLAFNDPEYCCTGEYDRPVSCKPNSYSQRFKAACPSAYSYAYDDQSSLHTCQGANYLIRFC